MSFGAWRTIPNIRNSRELLHLYGIPVLHFPIRPKSILVRPLREIPDNRLNERLPLICLCPRRKSMIMRAGRGDATWLGAVDMRAKVENEAGDHHAGDYVREPTTTSISCGVWVILKLLYAYPAPRDLRSSVTLYGWVWRVCHMLPDCFGSHNDWFDVQGRALHSPSWRWRCTGNRARRRVGGRGVIWDERWG